MPTFTIIHNKSTDDVFLEAFLIDATHLNNKGWKVSYDNPAEFDRQVQNSLGHPLVLYERNLSDGKKIWDHPVSETGSVTDNIEYQKPYVVGKSVHNKKVKDGLWHSSYKIIHEGAKRFLKGIKEASIDLFTSPYIVRPVLEDRQNIKSWAIIHNAIVSDPANGKQLAKVSSICEGSPQSACASLFASMDTPDNSFPKCGYCLGDSLKEYIQVTSHSFKNENASNNMSESQAATGQQQQTSNPNDNNNDKQTQQQLLQQQQKPNLGNDSTDNVQQNNNEQNDAQKTITQLQEQIKSLEAKNQTTNTFDEQTKKQEARIADLEKKLATRERTGAIEKLLTQAIDIYRNDDGSINEKEYNTNLDELVKEPYKLEHIQELIQARYVLHQQAKGKLTGNKASNTSADNDNVTSQVGESASSNYTEMNGSNTNSVNNNNESTIESKLSQPFVNILTHLGNERFQLRNKLSNGGLV